MNKQTDLERKGWEWAPIPASVIMSKDLSHADVRVYAYLLWRSGKKGQAWPKTETVASDLGMSDQAVRLSLKNLVSNHWIFRQRRFMGASITYVFEAQKDCLAFSRSSNRLDDVRLTGCTTVVQPVRRQNDNKGTTIKEQDKSTDKKPSVDDTALFKTRDIQKAYESCVTFPIDWVKGEGHAAKWLAENGYTPDDIRQCYAALKKQDFWKSIPLPLSSIKKQIGEWKSSNHQTEKYLLEFTR